MNIENSIKNVIETKLSDGTVEKIVAEKFENALADTAESLFKWNGGCKTVIESKLKEVLIPAIENYDFSAHVIKLDTILTEILNSTSLVDNKKLLENFKSFMIEPDIKEIKVSELFKMWCKFVAENVETSGIDVNFDDDVSYEPVEVTMTVEYTEGRKWSSFESATILFECEHDENMNFAIDIIKLKDSRNEKFDIEFKAQPTIKSLRYLNEFEMLLIRLTRARVKIDIDVDIDSDEITPDKQPEPSWS